MALRERRRKAAVLPKAVVCHHDKLGLAAAVEGVHPAQDLRDDGVDLMEEEGE